MTCRFLHQVTYMLVVFILCLSNSAYGKTPEQLYELARLRTYDASGALDALHSLEKLGTPKAQDYIRKLHDHPTPYIREEVIKIIGKNPQPEDFVYLIYAMKGQRPFTQEKASEIIKRMNNTAVIKEYAQVFNEQDERLRWEILEIFASKIKQKGHAWSDHPDSSMIIQKILDDPSPKVQDIFVHYFAFQRDQRAFGILLSRLDHPDEEIRENAAMFLTYYYMNLDKTSIPKLLKHIHDPNPQVRRSIVNTLRNNYHNQAVQQAIRKVAEDDEFFASGAANSVLQKNNHPDLFKLIRKRIRHKDPRIRADALSVFLDIDVPDDMYDDIIRMSSDKEPGVRWVVAALLGEMKGEKAERALKRLATDKERKLGIWHKLNWKVCAGKQNNL